MSGYILCVLSFVTSYAAGRRSLGHGVGVMLTSGYFYGILRVNLSDSAVQFVFDAGLLGLYAACFLKRPSPMVHRQSAELLTWFAVLIGWPILLTFIPLCPFLIQLVGLRYCALFLPLLLLAPRLSDRDLSNVGRWIAILNIAALAFGVSEYLLGVDRFYPRNAQSEIIYRSSEEGLLRIPAIFLNAHCYAGAMICTLPFLLWPYMRRPSALWMSLLAGGVVAACLGVLLSATRSNAIMGAGSVLMLVLRHRTLLARKKTVALLFLAGVITVYVVWVGDARVKRFEQLGDEAVVERRLGDPSMVPVWIAEILGKYPLGNGLGYSINVPHFLWPYLPFGWENTTLPECEYIRIAATQGVVGVFLWIGFLVWVFTRPSPPGPEWLKIPYTLMYSVTLLVVISGLWGAGCFSAVPMSAMIFIMMGLIGRKSTPVLPVRPKRAATTRGVGRSTPRPWEEFGSGPPVVSARLLL